MGVVMTAGNRRKVQTGTLTKDGHEVLRGCAGLLERAWHAKGRGGRGLIEMETAIGHHTVPVATVAWLVLSLLAGAGMGAIRAVTVTIWRAEDGSAWRHGTKFTAALWLVSLAAHFALDALVEHSTQIPLGTSSILLYLAVTIGVQREIVRWRAARLTPRVAVNPLEEPH